VKDGRRTKEGRRRMKEEIMKENEGKNTVYGSRMKKA
jgi:hypothetical protein